MDEFKEFLKEQKTEYDIGIINNGHYHKLPKPFENEQVIRFKWKKNSITSLIKKLNNKGIKLIPNKLEKNMGLYNIVGTNNKALIIYAIKSHIQLPESVLKYFMSGEKIYYIDTSKNEIKYSSSSTYNTSFGYYTLGFEQYLSDHYETSLGKFISKFTRFINKENDEIFINTKETYDEIIKIFKMAFFRNPSSVTMVNDKNILSEIMENGFGHEEIAYASEDIDFVFLKNFEFLIFINQTLSGFVTLKSLVSNIKIKEISCMIIPINPKFAIVAVPKGEIPNLGEYTNGIISLIEDSKALTKINKTIFEYGKNRKEDIIGIKSDLDKILSNYE